jgi:hypothetical protein
LCGAEVRVSWARGLLKRPTWRTPASTPRRPGRRGEHAAFTSPSPHRRCGPASVGRRSTAPPVASRARPATGCVGSVAPETERGVGAEASAKPVADPRQGRMPGASNALSTKLSASASSSRVTRAWPLRHRPCGTPRGLFGELNSQLHPHDTTPRRQNPGVRKWGTRGIDSACPEGQEGRNLQALLMPEEGLEPPTRGL